MAKKEPPSRFHRDPSKPQPAESALPQLTDKEVERVLIETIQISPSTARLAQRLRRITDSYNDIATAVNGPDLREYSMRNPDFSQTVCLGFYRRVIQTSLELRTEATKFLEDPANHYASERTRKRFKGEALVTYTRRYRNFGEVVRILVKGSDAEIGEWLSKRPLLDDLHRDNPYKEVVESGHTIGEIFVAVSNQISKQDLAGVHSFDSVEYADLIELVLSVIKQEGRSQKIVKIVQRVYEEKLSKVFFDLIAAYEYRAPEELKCKLPTLLRDGLRDGEPLYKVLYSLVKQLPEALTHDEHPGHAVSAMLVNELSDYSIPERSFDPHLSRNIFAYMIAAGQVQKEYAGLGSYQEFVHSLDVIAQKDGPNQDWFGDLRDQMIECGLHFPHKIVTDGQDIGKRIFDVDRDQHYEFDVTERVKELLAAGEYSIMEISIDESHYPIEMTALRGDSYDSIMQIHTIGDDHYLLNLMVTCIVDRGQEDELGFKLDLTRFCYQVSLNMGTVTVLLPIMNKGDVHPLVAEAALNHAKQLISLIDVNALKERTLAEKMARKVDQKPTSLKPGTHEQRKAEYQKAQQPVESAEAKKSSAVQLNPETFETDTAAEAEYSKYVPHQLQLSSALEQELSCIGKKGARANVLRLTNLFFYRYNNAVEHKPGRGLPMTDVYGPGGERVWRFRVTYNIRCIAVEIGNGQALVVMTDDHDGAYKDHVGIEKKVAEALARRTKNG